MFNVIGSIVAAVVSMIFGFLWYSDALFGKKWRAETGMTDEMMQSAKEEGMTKQIIFGLLAEIVTALVFSYFFFALGVVEIGPALVVAFWAWLGFCATLQLGGVLWGRNSMKLFTLTTIHRLLSFLLIAVVLVLI